MLPLETLVWLIYYPGKNNKKKKKRNQFVSALKNGQNYENQSNIELVNQIANTLYNQYHFLYKIKNYIET